MPNPSRTCLRVAALAGALAAVPTLAHAAGYDELSGTRDGQAVSERNHHIEMTFERDYARLKIRRTVHNAGHHHDEAVYRTALPYSGVATGLRTLGRHRGRDRWFAGELLEAKLASDRYFALTGMGVDEPRDPALLAWEQISAVTLRVFPIAPGADKTLEYTVDMPAVWDGGRWVIELESLGVQHNVAQLRLSAANRRDQLLVDGTPPPSGEFALDHALRIELVPWQVAPISLELAAVPTGAGRTIVHWRVGLAAEVSSVPARARVVVGLDLSRSLDPNEVEAQRHAALAYLEHFRAKAAEVTVLGFDHELHMLTPGFVPADEAIELLEAAPLERGNGSDLGLALTAADLLLRSTPDGHPRRMLLFTDFRLGSRLSPRDYEAIAANSGAVVHLASVVVNDEPWIARDDLHPWATVAANTGGVVWTAGAPEVGAAGQRAESIGTFEVLARPLSVDFPAVVGLGPAPRQLPETLPEGAGHETSLLLDRYVNEIMFTGLLWNTPIEVEARSNIALGDRWAALTFGTELMWGLEADEQLHVAQRGGVVSPMTSYLANESGVRPPQAIAPKNLGLIGKGGCGGTRSGRGSQSGVVFRGRLDRQAWLNAHANAAWLRCGGAGHSAELVLEATYDEIVDLRLTTPSGADAKRDACVLEYLWGLWLPSDDFVEERLDWHVPLRPS
ncbi:hypothetical protein DB30_02238 [Enhygromyxa salina]|uniref:VIT domain-containing protein n=1 Tax=Enhygromyxa salina TaxID=215803 RepID=A0A0C1ZM45_9BACT|nr:VWA domain-containing protein [Enhygromyxa salina]KIG11973.1 hypothetical protein DB30_02238 [Enhygromyxa salina]